MDRGLIQADKTGGGHRRLTLDAVLAFVRQQGREIADPEKIGLPPGTGISRTREHGAHAEFLAAMTCGDEVTAQRVILDLYIGGLSVATICDSVITTAFHRIGELWRCGELEVYEERRACENCNRVVHELRRAVGAGPPAGPVAMGGTLDGDPYTLAADMAELVLRDAGWRASSLGHMLPFETLRKAIECDHPQLMWISITSIRDPDQFIANLNVLFDTALSCGCALVVGGQALTTDIRQRLRYTTYCDNFGHLEAFAKTIRPQRARATVKATGQP